MSDLTEISAKVIEFTPIKTKSDFDALITFELIMPRIILAEFNTHRAFSRNSASSRAIPAKKMIESVATDPFIPVAWMKPAPRNTNPSSVPFLLPILPLYTLFASKRGFLTRGAAVCTLNLVAHVFTINSGRV